MARSAKTAGKRARKTARTRVRKNMDIDPVKLASARKALGTATDTETVDQALDLISFQAEVMSALDRLAAAGGLVDVFRRMEPAAEPQRGKRRR